MNLKKHSDDLLFLPLGGAGEIGMNLNLYQLDGKWLMVDFGAGFAEDYLPGVDMIVPDPDFIEKRKKDLVGLVLTHAHEDHLGAIVHLWGEFDCPIYATPFTAAFLKNKLADSGRKIKAKIIKVEPGSKFKVGPFDLEMVQITHSVPEMNAVVIRTKYGNVFHSGDWKFDPDPVISPESDFKKLKKYGDEGILAMISDSTNVFSEGHSGSEGELAKSLVKIIAKCPKMVVVTTFASNVARIESIARAAKKSGRKVILAGRSLWRIVAAAKEVGYLQDIPPFLEPNEIKRYKREEILVIATGCQGEPLAATAKIAHGSHNDIKLRPEDTVIFSSKIIPGNDKRIFRLFNKFIQMGVEVLTERDHFVHVSGHPNKEEMKKMYKMIKPKIAIPVHGEHTHIHEHAALAKKWGAKKSIQVKDGSLIKLAPGEPETLMEIEVGTYAIDGNTLIPTNSPIMKARRRMQRDGIVVVSLVIGKKGQLEHDPVVVAPGLLDKKEDSDILRAVSEEIRHALEDSLGSASKKGSASERIENVTRAAVRRVLKNETGKDPAIEVCVVGF